MKNPESSKIEIIHPLPAAFKELVCNITTWVRLHTLTRIFEHRDFLITKESKFYDKLKNYQSGNEFLTDISSVIYGHYENRGAIDKNNIKKYPDVFFIKILELSQGSQLTFQKPESEGLPSYYYSDFMRAYFALSDLHKRQAFDLSKIEYNHEFIGILIEFLKNPNCSFKPWIYQIILDIKNGSDESFKKTISLISVNRDKIITAVHQILSRPPSGQEKSYNLNTHVEMAASFLLAFNDYHQQLRQRNSQGKTKQQ